jgi:hypothetical protein
VTKLKRQYLQYNKLWFNNELPTDIIVRWSHKLSIMARWDNGEITINAKFKKWDAVWKLSLLHEMCHVATDDEPEEHGPRWKREMLRLAKLGVLDKLW